MNKTIFIKLIFISLVISISFWGCSPSFEKQFPDVFQEYRSLSQNKALAIAVDHTGGYVYGYSQGYDTIEEAKENALFQCEPRQKAYQIEEKCKIYMVNDKKVDKN